MFDFTLVHTYPVSQLFNFIQRGEVSFEELQELGLHYQKQAELRTMLEGWSERCSTENQDWVNACSMATTFENLKNWKGAINAHQQYLDKWEKMDPHPSMAHVQFCSNEIQRLERERDGAGIILREQLLKDMRDRNWRYPPLLMRYILGLSTPNPDELDETPAGRFLAAGLTLSMEDLVEEGLLPKDDRTLQNSILLPLYEVPQLEMNSLGVFPKNRTDVYMMGVKGSGKTCALAGIINELFSSGEVTYQPQINERGEDRCQPYYYGLIEGVRRHKALAPTATDTISFMKLDIGPKRNKPLTFVEMSGEAFQNMASAFSAREVWREMGASSCLQNTNDKILCFFVDYSLVIDSGIQAAQDITLSKALTVLANDGPDPSKPGKGCTLSRVRTVAIVVTKSDLMGPDLSYEERERIAREYVSSNLANFVQELKIQCSKHDINSPVRNQVYVFPYSLGEFYIGQSVQFKRDDSQRFVQFLKDSTGSRRGSLLDIFI